MRAALLLTFATAACAAEDSGPDVPDPPEICATHCIADGPPATWRDCCDSVTCYLGDNNEWVVLHCDPPLDPCEACTPDQLCVQEFNGTCGQSTSCVTRTTDCPSNACSPACEQAYCGTPYQCDYRPACGTESPLAFTCYGP
ncbi:MAG: hypothetical protein ACTHU0_15155 [Kofleriaceae bacterium]